MVSIKKITFIDTPEIIENKVKTYSQYLLSFSNNDNGDFSEINMIEEYFNNINDNLFDISENESFLIMDEENINFMEVLFNKIGLNFNTEDFSKNYYNNNLNIDFFSQYKERFIKIFTSLLTINDILDKINISGIKSLNYIDKIVLKNSSI
jgi:hypothetical protein